MRAIGASRRQVLGSVLLEAVAVGLVASVAGLVAGIGVAVGLQGAARRHGHRLPERWRRARREHGGDLARRRPRRQRRLGRVPGPPGGEGRPGRRHARRRRRRLGRQQRLASSSVGRHPASVPPRWRAGLFGGRRTRLPSASAPSWCSSAWPSSVRSSPARSAGCSARRCRRLRGMPGHARPARTPCGTRSAPRPRPRR